MSEKQCCFSRPFLITFWAPFCQQQYLFKLGEDTVSGEPSGKGPSMDVAHPASDSPASISPVRPTIPTMFDHYAKSNGHFNHHPPPHFTAGGGATAAEVNENNNVSEQQRATPGSVGNKSVADRAGSSMTSSSSTTCSSHPLFLFGVCRWPGCETPFDDLHSFTE